MISIGKLSTEAADYYLNQVAPGPEAYYLGSGEKPGTWVGRGCADLNLSGEVTPDALAAVLGGADPAGGGSLVTGKAAADGRLGGFDLTFSAPKGVSLLAALSKDKVAAGVRGAHDAAVLEALDYLQDHATWARRGHDGLRTEPTSGMVAAAFRHRTSRADDPQLHTHVVVANVVHGDDGRWSAIWGKPIYAQSRTAGFVYQAALRANLSQSLGLQWSPVSKGLSEPAGFSAAQLSAFSSRRRQVVAVMDDHGATSAKAAQVAALATRATKSTDHDQGRQLATWWATATGVGLDPEGLAAMVGPPRDISLSAEEQVEIRQALLGPNGLTAHSSVFERRDVVRAWAEAAGDGAHLGELESLTDAFLARPEVVALSGTGEPRYSTAGLMALEASLVDSALRQVHVGRATVSDQALRQALEARPSLSDEQVAMVTGLATCGSGVEVVVGRAGTGKTFALDAARAAWVAGGHRVIGTSLAARAAAELESGSGIASTSLARLLIDLERPESALAKDTVVVVDEAGMVGTRDLYRLGRLTEASGAKLVLVGDPHQLSEISAGGAFAALGTELGASELTHNRRQVESWERDALAELRSGNLVEAVDRYRAAGRINTAPSAQGARVALVNDWRAAWSPGASSIMVAVRRDDAEGLNALARATLKSTGVLAPEELCFDGRCFAVGDQVLALRNDARLGLTNGTRATVAGIDDEAGSLSLVTADDRELVVPGTYMEAGDLTHGYALTLHKAQGLTVDRAFLLGNEDLYREAGYVGLSRARQRNDLYLVAPSEPRLGVAGLSGPQSGVGVGRAEEPLDRLIRRLAVSRAQVLATEHSPPSLSQLCPERDALAAQLANAHPADPRLRLAALSKDLEAARLGLGHPDQRIAAWSAVETEALEATQAGLVAEAEAAGSWEASNGVRLGRLHRLDQAISDRRGHLGQEVAVVQPPWLTQAIGPPPVERAGPKPTPEWEQWSRAATALAAYRDRYQITDTDRALGPAVAGTAQHLTRQETERIMAEAARALGRELQGASRGMAI